MSTTHTTTRPTPTSATAASATHPARSRIDQILALIDEVLGDTVPAR